MPPYSVGYVKIPINKSYKIEAQKLTEENKTIIYPNPANTWFSLYSSSTESQKGLSKVELFSLTGNLIHSEYSIENAPIDISGIPSGIYLVKIFKNEEMVSVQTLIKTN